MNLFRATLLFGIAVASTSAFAEDETVGARQKSFQVTYLDGSKETYVARYRALVSYRKWQTGEASKPMSGHFIDDRQCHWDITTQVDRDVCLTSKSGQQFCQGSMSRVYGTSKAGKGSDFVLLKLHPETCGDAEGRYNSDVNDAKNAVGGALDGVMQNDLVQVRQDLANELKAKAVTPI